ncbi:MAG: patatin-like phospholipase family protein [Rhodospirillales bacterium]|jgi:NTE family protein|nr:patatin-like phospholipase family protein [Rhodospirillales bacterium]
MSNRTWTTATAATSLADRGKGVALALQGGGAHGAFTWGALDRLLEDGLAVDRVCGVSSGAITGAMLVQGLVRGGATGARAELRRLWDRVASAHALSPLRAGPLDRWLWGWDISNTPAWWGLDMAMRVFGPSQMNPLGLNPLRSVLADLLDRRLLADPAAPRLTVTATEVASGAALLFDNERITVEVLLASACVPFLFPAVELDGRPCWDGGYAGNPPLGPLLDPAPPATLVLIRAQAGRRAGLPSTQADIANRLTEIAGQNLLAAELAALPPGVRVIEIAADTALDSLPVSSKFNGEAAFLTELHQAGRKAAERAVATVPSPA